MALTKSTYRMHKNQVINVKDFGAVGDGVNDDTSAIQAAIDEAAQMFNEAAFPPAGVEYTPPIVIFPTGAYRLTDTLDVYVGLTLKGQGGVPYTVEHTRLIMDTEGGTVNVDKHILNLTRVYQSVARSNNLTVTIEDLGFWITNPNSTIIARGGIGWGNDGTIGTGGNGSGIYLSEPTIDTRIKRCNFYSMPNAGIFCEGTGSTGIAFKVHECEFDTPIVSMRFKDCTPDVHISESIFYGGANHIYGNNLTDATFIINGCEFQQNPRIEIENSTGNNFTFVGNVHAGGGSKTFGIELDQFDQINISSNTFGVSSGGTLNITDANNGIIANNSIENSGYNAVVSSAATDPGVIRLVGCQNVMVSNNVMTTPASATYNGFGIITLDNGARSSECMIYNNFVSADYNGTAYRGQARRFNFADGDVCANNTSDFDATTSTRETRVVDNGVMLMRAVDQFTVASSANVEADLDGLSFAKVTFHAAMLSTTDNKIFEVLVKKNTSTGAWTIADVTVDGTNGSGLGPHTLSASHTITFSIVSSTILRAALSLASDSMLISYLTVGTKV